MVCVYTTKTENPAYVKSYKYDECYYITELSTQPQLEINHTHGHDHVIYKHDMSDTNFPKKRG